MNIQAAIFSQMNVADRVPSRVNLLERTPYRDSVSFSGTENIEDKVKKVLDEKEFEFKKDNGDIYKGTIRGYFENSIICMRSAKNLSLIHCTDTKETACSIIKNGLDWQKTSRMKCGPGTYFSLSAYGGKEQGAGNVPIEGIYKGVKTKYPVFESCFYNAVDYNKDIHESIKDITPDTRMAVNKYCHDLLQNDMGIDILYAASGRGTGAFCVINNGCMKLSPYYW